MAHSPVVIVGAGPSGLVLALSLAKYGVSSTILEKEEGITEDPRGVFLAGDANRILEDLGIHQEQMQDIGHAVEEVRFHKSNFQNKPFIAVDTRNDKLHQVVPDGVLQIQPRLERALCDLVGQSPYCDLREGCEVTGRTESTGQTAVHYTDHGGTPQYITCTWLVGADGKKGIVRKKFLEPTAGIRQETGLFSYEGTWIAANLKITLPVPQSHPDFSLWKLGYTPENVYDLFWPKHWHFCSPPGSPTACGRFGPHADRIWRHEIAIPSWVDGMGAEKILLEHLLPMVTRATNEEGKALSCGEVAFPRDCIEILRCRPFQFAQKVVNRWFHSRTILIGDAAHVFPPFGGQGIACGMRDAYALAWRLAALLTVGCPAEGEAAERMLSMWAAERKQGVEDSTKLTRINGMMWNKEESLLFWAVRKGMDLLGKLPFFGFLEMNLHDDSHGYRPTRNGCFLPDFGGGGKTAQVYVRADGEQPIFSDQLLQGPAIFTMLGIGGYDSGQDAQVKAAIREAILPPQLISEDSIVYLDPDTAPSRRSSTEGHKALRSFHLCREEEVVGVELRPGYDPGVYVERLGRSTRFAIIRPDCIIFAAVGSVAELRKALSRLGRMFSEGC